MHFFPMSWPLCATAEHRLTVSSLNTRFFKVDQRQKASIVGCFLHFQHNFNTIVLQQFRPCFRELLAFPQFNTRIFVGDA